MRPLDDEMQNREPDIDIACYECHSVSDYLENKDNREEFPAGEMHGLIACILGTQKLTVKSAEIRTLSDVLDRESYSVWELNELNEELLAYKGIVIELTDAYMHNAPKASLFCTPEGLNQFSLPKIGSALVQDSLIYYPPLLGGTKLDGFFGIDGGSKRYEWNPKSPLNSPKHLERV